MKVVTLIEAIAYFDIFNHPLKRSEIENLSNKETHNINYDEMTKINILYEHKGYYSLKKNVKELVEERLKKEKEAQKYIRRLPFIVSLISKFPFVRGVAISGSLSKGVMHSNGDIDYFIITAINRLWICRSFLILFKKIFLLNSKKYFCVNYFVDENNLGIKDQNMFTAIEIAYLLPVYNEGLVNQLKEKNSWTKEYFPNFKHPLELTFNTHNYKNKQGLEVLFKRNLGDKLDLWLMKISFKRWKKKFNHFDNDKFELTLRTNRGISKHHPQDFQNKVLTELNEKMSQIKNKL